jgi:hypothetical protein
MVDYSTGLLYRPASLRSLASRHDKPYARVDFFPPVRDYEFGYSRQPLESGITLSVIEQMGSNKTWEDCGHRVYRVPVFLPLRPNWVHTPNRSQAVLPPPPLWIQGRKHSRLLGRGGGTQFRLGDEIMKYTK